MAAPFYATRATHPTTTHLPKLNTVFSASPANSAGLHPKNSRGAAVRFTHNQRHTFPHTTVDGPLGVRHRAQRASRFPLSCNITMVKTGMSIRSGTASAELEQVMHLERLRHSINN